MGAFELFLVPVGNDENGFRYEAVFNYFKEVESSISARHSMCL